MKEASFYFKKDNGVAVCTLCPHKCHIVQGRTGACKARRNNKGKLIAESYGCVSCLNLDPIEKKPLRKFYPGNMILSAGSYGCNMKCGYCQNYAISQQKPEVKIISPEDLLIAAKETAGNIGIAFTYNEPLVGIEYILDAAPLLKKEGLKVVLVTNGMINHEPLKALLPYVDAMNIDVKAFNREGYMKLGGSFMAVMATVEAAAAVCHVEITALIVPGLNDGGSDMGAFAERLADISSEIPLHISRFFPRHKMTDAEPTPVGTMKEFAIAAQKHLKYVYLGNI